MEAPRTLVELIEGAAARYTDRPAVALRLDDGATEGWTYRELERRSRIAAWRLRSLGLEPGDRVLTWSPSSPSLVATYLGAMRARLIYVPLDLQMSPAAVQRVAERSEARQLLMGTGRDVPDPDEAGLGHLPRAVVETIAADADPSFPGDWEAQQAAWDRPTPDEIFQLVFTSGTTGTPKGVMLSHEGICSTIAGIHRVIPPMEHRVTSVLPLSHLYEQAVGTFYPLDVGADILHVRSRMPRVILQAIREHRTTSMITVPGLLDVFWTSLEREVAKRGRKASVDRLRRIASYLPFVVRRRLFRSLHQQALGTDFRLFVSIGAYLPPSLQLAWESIGITVLQGYGSTESAFGAANTPSDRGLGTVGRTVPPFELRISPDGEVLFRGPSLFKGYWHDPEATAAVFDAEGWYHTGDAGHFDKAGRLVLSGRTRDMIVLPNGFNVFPEDIENELRNAGVRNSVVLQTAPGRIEAIVLATDAPALVKRASQANEPAGEQEAPEEKAPEALRARMDGAVKAANAVLGINQRIDGWRLWPEDDFPRTHTLKVRRNLVQEWADRTTREQAAS
jgi:long-chain acyl-CoA synthetase